MKPLAHSLRSFGRGWRGGELAMLLASVALSVGAMAAVALFTERVQLGMERQAGEALAADLVVESRDPLPRRYAERAAAAGLTTAELTYFPSVATTADASQLVEVRAVTTGYPLRGTLRVADRPYARGTPLHALPGPGELWAESRLFAALGIEPGTRVRLGAREFVAARVLDYLPDQGWNFVDVAPTALIRAEDLAATGLVGPASRVTHRLLVAGDVTEFKAALATDLARGQRLLDARDGRPEMRTAIARAERFLGLAALVAVLLAAVAVAMAARRWAKREADAAAILKCLGAKQRVVLASYALVVLWVALVGGLVGAAVGVGAQAGLVALLGDLLPADLPAPSLAALPGVIALGGVVLAGFALPPVIALGRTPPLRVLRHDLGPVPLPAQLATLAATAAVIALLAVQTKDLTLASYTLGGLGAVVVVFALTALLLLKLLGRLRGRVGVAWRYGVANVVRRGRESVAQLTAFGIGIAVLLLLTLTRSGLLEDWRATLPDDAPNRFLINIQTAERVAVTEFLTERGLPPPVLAPMVRARLVAIDGVAIEQVKLDNPRVRAFAEREANLSFSAALPYGNEIWEGRFWDAGALPTEPEVSFEFEIGKALGLKIGSTVTYDVVGEQVTAKVTSLRQVDWDSFRPNFFILFSPGALEQAPATWITSLHLPAERAPLLLELTRAFPSVTIIDTDVILDQVRDVISRASLTVEFVFLFTLGAGVLVLLAAIQSSRDERRFESAVLRTLGATRRTVLVGVAAEFLLLGLLAGLLAVLAAGALEWLLATKVFEMPWRPDPLLALTGGLLGTLLVGVTGVLATRDVVTHPPVETLRRG